MRNMGSKWHPKLSQNPPVALGPGSVALDPGPGPGPWVRGSRSPVRIPLVLDPTSGRGIASWVLVLGPATSVWSHGPGTLCHLTIGQRYGRSEKQRFTKNNFPNGFSKIAFVSFSPQIAFCWAFRMAIRVFHDMPSLRLHESPRPWVHGSKGQAVPRLICGPVDLGTHGAKDMT